MEPSASLSTQQRIDSRQLLQRTYLLRIIELRTYAMIDKTNPRSRKATVLMVKQRAAYLTYRSALTRFGHNPSMETMVSVRATLKELYHL